MPKEKENPKNWINGDVFSLEIKNSKEVILNGKHFIFIKIDDKSYKRNFMPIFRVKITSDNQLPKTKEEIEKLEYVQTDMTLWEDRFNPLEGAETEEQLIKERSKVKFYPDEFGYLSQYRISTLINLKLPIHKELKYLGNFDITPPKNEYIPFCKLSIILRRWDDIEQFLLMMYLRHNKKDSTVYNMEYAEAQRKIADKINKGNSLLLKKIGEEEKKGNLSEKRIKEIVLETIEEENQ